MCNAVENEYLGYKIIHDGEDIAKMYESDMTDNCVGCLTNEYAITTDADGNAKDRFRWNGNKFVRVCDKPIVTKFGGKVSARNLQQELALDLIQNESITIKMIAGRFGSGKTFLLSAAAIQMVERGVFDQIVFIRNNVEVRGSKPIGFLPGEYNDKLAPFAACFADHIGGESGLEMMMRDRKVVIQHLGFLRGRDIKNSVIFVSEAENLTKEHIQLIISRAGEGSQVWFDGDLKQRDAELFEKNSGMALAIDRLKGHPRFGYVKLLKSERSETAAMADLLD